MLANPIDNTLTDQSTRLLLSPRPLIERISELLSEGTLIEEIQADIVQLLKICEGHFVRDLGKSFYEETVFETPWLTPISECLRQQQTELNKMIGKLNQLLSLGSESAESRQIFCEQFECFADLFFEHDMGVQNLMHTKDSQH